MWRIQGEIYFSTSFLVSELLRDVGKIGYKRSSKIREKWTEIEIPFLTPAFFNNHIFLEQF